MQASLTFVVAVRILLELDLCGGRSVCSDALAYAIGVSPALARRVMRRMAAVGLLATRLGAGGGSRLARQSDQINLFEVYRALGGDRNCLSYGGDLFKEEDQANRRIERLLNRELEQIAAVLDRNLLRLKLADLETA
ncbi:Rrf2 family transcriptional regulator [uncultured Xanthomonas sp.]|uniref:RrF2 family transcriptional regulator n=1 Tax=uncultured Xanthomonas sp. TaxID=152831 RepID=UPI0025D23585|nr:Rrf2 family transcriptional regulator [uncultured Xanthomonas sp.]